MSATMEELAACAEKVASTPSRNEKIGAVAEFLRTLNDADFPRAALYLSGATYAATDKRKVTGGYSLFRIATAAVTGWSPELIGACHREVGDTGETVSLLCRAHTRGESMTLERAAGLYDVLSSFKGMNDTRITVMVDVIGRYSPMAVKYFIKAINGDLRIGLQLKMVEEAIAIATGQPAEAVRAANNRSGDIAAVARAARRGELGTIQATLFHPMDFMLAQPLDEKEPITNPDEWLVEDKYDGIRAQLHIAEGRTMLFSRGLDDVTAAFPDVVRQVSHVSGPCIVDGEILAWQDGKPMLFQALQQRIARKVVPQETIEAVPVIFLAYDILMHEGRLVMDQPVEARRKMLEATGMPNISPQTRLSDLDAQFAAARSRENEGLVLKRIGSVYESGKRSSAWRKVKRVFGTLDVVVTAAEQGHGRRAGVLSDVTFAVRDGDRFVNIGKAYSGLTDDEIRQLTRVFRAAATDRFGSVTLVRPEVVLEVAFDGVQKSTRHKSGYALRFPRILRWRTDKKPDEIDTLDRVAELYGTR